MKWTKRYFEKDITALNHVVFLSSKEYGVYWLHTRDMADFGRPDISIKNIEEDLLHDYKQIIDQMIFYGGQGTFFTRNVKLHTYNRKIYIARPEFVNNLDIFHPTEKSIYIL